MWRKIISLSGVLLFSLTLVVGCTGSGEEKEKEAATIENEIVQIKGSDTMVILSQALAEEFMKKNPGTSLAVKGGGSGIGITALIDGTTDIANSSRKMKEEEKEEARSKGIEPVEYVIALDGLAIITNPANPVSNLTLNQLKDIYTGQINNWKQLGGPDLAVRLISRESNSGSYAYFREHVLKDGDYGARVEFVETSKAVTDIVTQDPAAIGYVGEAYAQKGVKKIKIAQEDGKDYLEPTKENILNGKYPISRPLQVYTAGQPAGIIKDFVEYMLSSEGQAIVEKIGYTPIN